MGKMHYSLRALLERGWIKAGNLRRSDHQRACIYKLTPPAQALFNR